MTMRWSPKSQNARDDDPARRSGASRLHTAPPSLLSLQHAAAAPRAAPPTGLLALQRTFGNRAVCDAIQREPIGAQGGAVDAPLREAIHAARGGGQPLERETGERMGRALGTDLRCVTVHTDARADTLNRALSASAFTLGRDIFFSRGAYQPNTPGGRELLAHELTHVAQQGATAARLTPAELHVGPAGDRHEQEAEQMGGRARAALAPGAPPAVRTIAGTSIQRTLKFGVDELRGDISATASINSLFGKSTFVEIQKALKAYWAIKPGGDAAVQRQARARKVALLQSMGANCAKWLASFEQMKNPTKTDWEKANSIKKLAEAVKYELYDAEYFDQFDKDEPLNSLVDGVTSSTLGANARLHKIDLKAGRSGDDDEREQYGTYRSLKGMGMRSSELAALQGYTGHQFEFMNPAMAGNKGWLKSRMAEFGKQTSDTDVDAAMHDNQVVAKYALAGLNKLPAWKQDQTIYRGETLPEAEGMAMGPGTRRHYPHFVSTSLSLTTPQTRLRASESPERPYKVIYHITKTYRAGRDVGALAKSGRSEKEILFPPDTTFVVNSIKTEEKANKYKEVEVVTT